MSSSTLAVLSSPDFPQVLRSAIDRAVDREIARQQQWPESVKADQVAIEQARRELGPGADPKKILARAQQIKQEADRG